MRIDNNLVVFVTGAASGLGEAAVIRLHELGAKVAAADLNVAPLQAL